jgi:hypothetical protein
MKALVLCPSPAFNADWTVDGSREQSGVRVRTRRQAHGRGRRKHDARCFLAPWSNLQRPGDLRAHPARAVPVCTILARLDPRAKNSIPGQPLPCTSYAPSPSRLTRILAWQEDGLLSYGGRDSLWDTHRTPDAMSSPITSRRPSRIMSLSQASILQSLPHGDIRQKDQASETFRYRSFPESKSWPAHQQPMRQVRASLLFLVQSAILLQDS